MVTILAWGFWTRGARRGDLLARRTKGFMVLDGFGSPAGDYVLGNESRQFGGRLFNRLDTACGGLSRGQ
jgi:hypothetical protein